MKQLYTAYAQTNKFSKLVNQWLAKQDDITPFFENYPDVAGFKKQLVAKQGFPAASREVLVTSLKEQYSHIKLENQEREELNQRLELLLHPETYTVTTGHQLCLFTGPLYTVYKILHVIRLAEELTKELGNATVLPIFWIATEDHDFEEVNHVRYHKHKLVWHAQSGDAVGRMETHAIAPVINDLANRLPQGQNKEQIISDLKEAYEGHTNLADATRCLVHKWFGDYGIIVVDGDDAALKSLMIPAFAKELTENASFKTVSATNSRLEQKYSIQVTPREINLFYLNKGVRSRIVEENGIYNPLAEKKNWSKEAILRELHSHPERFSPNVLLRPLYQETILPNLGYIGGGGELAYWAQLRGMFNAFNVPFPVVILRQSVQLVPKRIARKLQKLELEITDLFTAAQELKKQLVRRNCDFDAEIEEYKGKVDLAFKEVLDLAENLDATLAKHVLAQQTKALNSIDGIEKKMFRAAKRNEEDVLRMLDEALDVLQPGGGLQERHDNIIEHLIEFGPGLIEEVYKAIKPLNYSFLSMVQEP